MACVLMAVPSTQVSLKKSFQTKTYQRKFKEKAQWLLLWFHSQPIFETESHHFLTKITKVKILFKKSPKNGKLKQKTFMKYCF